MRLLIRGGRVLDPASGRDEITDVALASGRVVRIGAAPPDFSADRELDASGCWLLPGLVDLNARLGEPGNEHAGMLESEMTAAVAGGVTSLVCPPDTDPILDEPGLVEMLRMRAEKLHQAHVFPQGALTRQLQGKILSELVQLADAGCVAFGQAETPIVDTRVLQRALQYAATFGHSVWLRPQEPWLCGGVAASGAVATRKGLSGVPVLSETIALHVIFDLLRGMSGEDGGPHVHICRLSSAAGVALLRQARAEGLNVTADVSIHSLLLTDEDIGDFDARTRLQPPLRQARDRAALGQALADGTIDALVSDHTPVRSDAKELPFAQAEPGATALELLLALALQWGRQDGGPGLQRALSVVTQAPAAVLGAALGTFGASCGRLIEGGVADLCVFEPDVHWFATADALCSQGKLTPFSERQLQGRVRHTLVGGQLAYSRATA